MGLRFFADHCVPSSIIRVLQNAGHQVVVLREHIPVDSPDAAVIAKDQELEAILLSLNGDFADITTYPPSEFKGIIALQVKNHPEVIPALMERLMGYISGHPELADYRGKLLIAEVHRIRIRR
jgi:predicted nuclease of predicted toxin-antitoxin system